MNENGALHLNPAQPTIYLGFSGVIHVGEGLVAADGTVTLDSGNKPFHLAHLLTEALTPYPQVQLILTTTWTRTLGEERTVAMLPSPLRERVVGTTLKFPGRLGELRDGTWRTGSILRHASACAIDTWLALGDDFFGVPSDMQSHFVRLPSETGLAAPEVLGRLRTWLAENGRRVASLRDNP